MSLNNKFFGIGEDVLSSARRRFLPLEPTGDVNLLEESGWDSTTYGTSFYASRLDDTTQTHAFMCVRTFAARPEHLACLLREFDLGKLAGELREFRVVETSDTDAVVEYVSNLPWPFEPRWIRAKMRFGVVRQTGAIVILGESVPATTAPSGMTLGTIHYSYYYIAPAEVPGTCIMRRIINVDMHLPLPRFVIQKSLDSHYQTDMALIDADLAAWEGSELQKRFRSKDCYPALERAVLAAETVAGRGR